MLDLVPPWRMFINYTKDYQNPKLLFVLDSTPGKIFFTAFNIQMLLYVLELSSYFTPTLTTKCSVALHHP